MNSGEKNRLLQIQCNMADSFDMSVFFTDERDSRFKIKYINE